MDTRKGSMIVRSHCLRAHIVFSGQSCRMSQDRHRRKPDVSTPIAQHCAIPAPDLYSVTSLAVREAPPTMGMSFYPDVNSSCPWPTQYISTSSFPNLSAISSCPPSWSTQLWRCKNQPSYSISGFEKSTQLWDVLQFARNPPVGCCFLLLLVCGGYNFFSIILSDMQTKENKRQEG